MKLYLANPLTPATAAQPFRALWLDPKSLDERQFKVKQDTLRRVFSSMQSQKNAIPLMYAHGLDPAKGKKAAGWVKEYALHPPENPVEILVTPEWTALAKTEIDAGEWGFISPGLDADRVGENLFEPTGIFEISITNTPVLDDQNRIAAERNEGGHEMDTKSLAKLAGLPDDATVEQIEAALQKKLATPPTPPAPESMTDAQVSQLAERLGLSKLGDTILTAARTHADGILAAERKEARVTQLLDRGKRDGKITEGMRKATVDGKEVDPIKILAESNPEAFAAWLEKAPRVSPVPGSLPGFELSKDTIAEGKAVTPGAFSKADLTDTDTRQLLHLAAQKMVAEKKAVDYAAATLMLTQPISAAAQ